MRAFLSIVRVERNQRAKANIHFAHSQYGVQDPKRWIDSVSEANVDIGKPDRKFRHVPGTLLNYQQRVVDDPFTRAPNSVIRKLNNRPPTISTIVSTSTECPSAHIMKHQIYRSNSYRTFGRRLSTPSAVPIGTYFKCIGV